MNEPGRHTVTSESTATMEQKTPPAALPVSPPAAGYAADALLRDGRSVHVRAIRPDDKERLRDHFSRLGPDSVYNRFFGVKKELSDTDLHYFTELDFDQHVGLTVAQRVDGVERFLGIGRFIRRDGGGSAELGMAVADEAQGLGVGTLLLEHLAHLAAAEGVTEIVADVLPTNHRMVEMLRNSGFVSREAGHSASLLRLVLVTRPTEALRHSVDERQWTASAASVRTLLNPRSVALVGASRQEGALGRTILDNLGEFKGQVYAVNPNASTIGGRPCYARMGDVPGPVDLAVIAVPAPHVEAALADCAAAGVRSAVVISAGFGEASAEGRAAQDRLRTMARQSGLRLVGPNCLGVMNSDPAVRLNATFAPEAPAPGNVGFLSQSGALGLVILDHAHALNLGLSSFVSVGNKADVSGNDLLAYWKDDPRTRVVALYLESFGNPRRFARLAPEVARHKPVVAVKSGRSKAGRRAAASHSASLACSDVAVDALFAQAGVIRTDTLEELFDVIALLSTQPVPPGPRVGVVTNAGGPGILLADACESLGLTVPELAPETQARLRTFLPAAAGLRNPVDMIASASPAAFEQAIQIVGGDASVDAVVVIYVPPQVTKPEEIAAAVARGAGAVPAAKPVLNVFLSTRGAPALLASGPRGPLPSFSFPENAARALAAAERYGRWRERPRGTVTALPDEAQRKIRAVVDPLLAAAQEPFWLDADAVQRVLDAAGIGRPEARLVAAEQAAAAAEELGGPLVVKAVAPGLVHKTDVGGVALGLNSKAEVRAAVEGMSARLLAAGHRLEGVLLQREAGPGVDALVGVTADPTFGPLVVCGMGGVQAELMRDVSVRLSPVSDLDAREMLDGLRLGTLLGGYRGAPPADRAAFLDLVQRVAALAEALPELQDLDLNPVRVFAAGSGAVALDARIRLAPAGYRA